MILYINIKKYAYIDKTIDILAKAFLVAQIPAKILFKPFNLFNNSFSSIFSGIDKDIS